MKSLGIAVALVSLVTGLRAAYLWYKASKIQVDPGWRVEPGETEAVQDGWIAGIMCAVNRSADLNKTAAIWTAYSLAVAAASTLIGSFA